MTGELDNQGCFRLENIVTLPTSIMNVPFADATERVLCLNNALCSASGDSYDPASAMQKPPSHEGCTLDPESANQVTLTGYLLDNLCVDNFLIGGQDSNGGVGYAPDKTDIRNFVEEHTRGCLLLPNCAATGYSLIVKDPNYARLAMFEGGNGNSSSGLVWDYIINEPRQVPAECTDESLADGAVTLCGLDEEPSVENNYCFSSALATTMIDNQLTIVGDGCPDHQWTWGTHPATGSEYDCTGKNMTYGCGNIPCTDSCGNSVGFHFYTCGPPGVCTDTCGNICVDPCLVSNEGTVCVDGCGMASGYDPTGNVCREGGVACGAPCVEDCGQPTCGGGCGGCSTSPPCVHLRINRAHEIKAIQP